ncbi:MAG: endonuclease domain-containing protein [Candidatus Peribacteraceae bacterium]|nr:endonuclease domain-containing protein [Candidatus Peribacteraceae bacterium]
MDEKLHLTHQNFQKILFARELRRKPTETESILWEALRDRKTGCKFRRQVPLGSYIADFCCMKHRCIIEIDGGIHNQKKEYDAVREERLLSAGFKIIHFTNNDILHDKDGCLQKIRTHS